MGKRSSQVKGEIYKINFLTLINITEITAKLNVLKLEAKFNMLT